MKRALLVLAKGAVLLALVPWALLRLSETAGAVWPPFNPSWWGLLVGLALEVLGAYAAVRAYLILTFVGKGRPFHPPAFLVDRYIYRFVRHPIYWGYVVFWLGFGLRRGRPAFIAGALVVGLVLAGYALWVEEPDMKRRFGPPFEAYRRRVPLVFPVWKELVVEWTEFNWFLLTTATLFRGLASLVWHLRAEGTEHIPRDGGCMVIGNHSNLLDPFFVGMSSTRPIRFMATDETFRKPVSRLLFTLWGAFPIRRWDRDIGALRKVRRWLAEGRFIGMFPEGQRTWDGSGVVVGDEVYRFLHHCHAPILCASLIGAHEAFPRWAKLPALARVTVRFFPLLDPDQFASVAELRRAIEERIFSAVNEPPVPRTWLRSHRGITKVVWGCIECGGVRTLSETSDSVVCSHCGAAWEIDECLNFVSRRSGIVLREREYHAELRRRLAAGKMQGGLSTACKATAHRMQDGAIVRLGEGRLSLDREHFSFEGEGVVIRKPLAEIRTAYVGLVGQLVVCDAQETLQFEVHDDSTLRLEEYFGVATNTLMPQWIGGEAVRPARRAGE